MSNTPRFYKDVEKIIKLLEPIMTSCIFFDVLVKNDGKFLIEKFEDFVSNVPLEILVKQFNETFAPETNIFSEDYWKKKIQYCLEKNPNFIEEMENDFLLAKNKIFKNFH